MTLRCFWKENTRSVSKDLCPSCRSNSYKEQPAFATEVGLRPLIREGVADNYRNSCYINLQLRSLVRVAECLSFKESGNFYCALFLGE